MADPHPTRNIEDARGAEGGWRRRLHTIIYEADTPAGRAFDIGLLIAIIASIVIVALETVQTLPPWLHTTIFISEWVLTGVFTLELLLRLIVIQRPIRYIATFYGLVDLLSILPTWVALFVPGAQAFLIVRALRLIRVFRIFKMGRMVTELAELRIAFLASRAKMTVFLYVVAILVILLSALMYIVEGGPGTKFENIPDTMYWTVVTMTTVGYGDITPITPLGKLLAVVMMLLGYSIIVVPTGILSAEVARASHATNTQHCHACGLDSHEDDARYCRRCGVEL